MARPPMYKSAEEMQEKINAYFESCEGKLLLDENGRPMLTKNGEPVWIGRRPLTIQGLALALGFTSRQSLLNYRAKKEFMDVLSRARLRVEQYAAEQLFDRDAQRGAQFTLACGFNYRLETEKNEESSSVKIEMTRGMADAAE